MLEFQTNILKNEYEEAQAILDAKSIPEAQMNKVARFLEMQSIFLQSYCCFGC